MPAGGAGTYYIEAWWDQLGSLETGSYGMWVSIQSPSTAVRITAPAVKARLRTNRSYTSWGTLQPLHYAGDSTVKIVWQKYYRGRWRTDSTSRPQNEDYYNGATRYTRFEVSYSFWGLGSGTMRWRVQAVHPADRLHPSRSSAWRYFTVKN